MKKFLCSMFVAAFAAGMAVSAVSMTAGPAWADDEEQPKAEKKHKKHAGPKAKSATGKIKSMDAKGGTVTIVKKKKGVETEYVISVTSKTKFKEIASLEDLKVGDKITAKYTEKDGKMVAKSIEKKIPGKGKKKAYKKKKKEGDEEKSEEKSEE